MDVLVKRSNSLHQGVPFLLFYPSFRSYPSLCVSCVLLLSFLPLPYSSPRFQNSPTHSVPQASLTLSGFF
ncbi:hypothetical protein CSUI_008230 [Cystoisospora suis]|uniref:Uncharacterized protein n=1 Tax=Cystoisospora suis TaxID=483139 RepID=A0A2C6KN97_9APIC|nr:hypothetical protein CSUI_008230 [Cystoisospora suis]